MRYLGKWNIQNSYNQETKMKLTDKEIVELTSLITDNYNVKYQSYSIRHIVEDSIREYLSKASYNAYEDEEATIIWPLEGC
jgi:hypothetical protein